LLVSFYQFNKAPLFFDQVKIEKLANSPYKDSLLVLQNQWDVVDVQKKQVATAIAKSETINAKDQLVLKQLHAQEASIRQQFKTLLTKADAGEAKASDTNYIFLRFVKDHMPEGLIGLIIAIIFLASWGSIAAALNSLASTTVIDFHCRFRQEKTEQATDYRLAKWYTLGWGLFCIVIAQFATGMGSLIEAVNLLGSLFYGVILGIFLVAFYAKSVGGNAVFWGAVVAQIGIFVLYFGLHFEGFLWMNVIGALLVICLSFALHLFAPKPKLN
jgi:solute:Na+ symporter, SSS family